MNKFSQFTLLFFSSTVNILLLLLFCRNQSNMNLFKTENKLFAILTEETKTATKEERNKSVVAVDCYFLWLCDWLSDSGVQVETRCFCCCLWHLLMIASICSISLVVFRLLFIFCAIFFFLLIQKACLLSINSFLTFQVVHTRADKWENPILAEKQAKRNFLNPNSPK